MLTLDCLHTAFTRGQQVEVTLEVDVTDGKTIAQIEKHIQILNRRVSDQTIAFDVMVGRNMLEQISRVEAIRILESTKLDT